MCGIVGLIQNEAGKADRDAIRNAADTLYARGPDDSGVWVENNIGLGHRRLSILDVTAAGKQPMTSVDSRYVTVFNGEIYNFNELRKDLRDSDSPWLSGSDTEVLLAAYARWGIGCIHRLRGMFAFAIWDRHKKVLFAARDRMGVKPFYYHSSRSCFAFASRPRALFSLCRNLSPELDEQALRYYLECGYVPAPFSIHKAVKKLPPAHYLLATDRGHSIHRYWDFRHIPPEPSWIKRNEKDLLDEFDELVNRTIKSRMVSDVPLGAFLSGGIDSSLIAAVMAKHSPNPVKTFTIGFEDTNYDESSHATAVAQQLGTDHHCEVLNVDSLIDLLPLFANEYDEPFFDSSAFPTMAVSRLARKHVTVSLSGDGGDELFGGYHYYKLAELLDSLYRVPRVARTLISRLAGSMPVHRLKLLSGALMEPSATNAFAFTRSIAKDYSSVLLPEVHGRTEGIGEMFVQTTRGFAGELRASEKGMRLDTFHTLPDDYLQKTDVASMAFSLESREPLLDHELVEWAMKLPVKWKLHRGTNKYLLRMLAYRYVPRAILDRPKQGFRVPIDRWLRGPLKTWALERLNDREIYERLPLSQANVLSLFKLHEAGFRDAHPLLWAILMLIEFSRNQTGRAAQYG